MAVDDSYTKSLLHFNGDDASTTFTDESGKTWTAGGNAQLDTAQKKFGTASGLLDGTGDYIDTPDTADHEPAAGDFTVDHWIRFNSIASTQSQWARRTAENADGSGNQKDFFGIFWNTDNTLHFDSIVNDTEKGRYYCSWTPSTGVWYHLAFVRNGSNFYIFIDGVSQTLTTTVAISTNDLTFAGPYQAQDKLTIGRYGNYDGFYFNGWIDEFRFSKGIARWTSNFTPPTMEYPIITSIGSKIINFI